MGGFENTQQIWGENKVGNVPNKSVVEKVGESVNSPYQFCAIAMASQAPHGGEKGMVAMK